MAGRSYLRNATGHHTIENLIREPLMKTERPIETNFVSGRNRIHSLAPSQLTADRLTDDNSMGFACSGCTNGGIEPK